MAVQSNSGLPKGHRFYQKSRAEQGSCQRNLGIAALGALLLIGFLSWLLHSFVLLPIFAYLLLTVLAPFFDVPGLVRRGVLSYYSPLFLVEKTSSTEWVLHGGSLFDCVFVLRPVWSGRQRSTYSIYAYLRGLYLLLCELEACSGSLPQLTGTTHIMSARTAYRLGFHISSAIRRQVLLLSLSYPNLLVTASIARRRLVFPRLHKIRIFKVPAEELSVVKLRLEALIQGLKKWHSGVRHTYAAGADTSPALT